MKYKKYIVILLVIFFGLAITNASISYAQTSPDSTGGTTKTCAGFYFLTGCTALTEGLAQSQGFTGIFNTLLKVVIALAGIWAVIELSYYGARYALVDSFTGKKDAIKNIWPVAYGLIALLATVLLFNQINPKIVGKLNAPHGGISRITPPQQNAANVNPKCEKTSLGVCRDPDSVRREREERQKRRDAVAKMNKEKFGNKLPGKDNFSNRAKKDGKLSQKEFEKYCKRVNQSIGKCAAQYGTIRACAVANSMDSCKRIDTKYLDLFNKAIAQEGS